MPEIPKKKVERPVAKEPPLIRFAHVPGAQGDNVLLGRNGVPQLPKESWPAFLVSYWYVDKFDKQKHRYAYRDWMLDSGAFSAYNSGASIDLEQYIEYCHAAKANDPTLVEIIALDEIAQGTSKRAKIESGRRSLANALRMRANGLDVIPVFHIGEEWDVLLEYCRQFDKVGLSCRFGEPVKESIDFYGQCFARVWPKKCHSFGWVAEKMLFTYPFHSSDSADWEIKPCNFGHWRAFGPPGGTAYINWKGSDQNLRAEVEWYLNLEQRLRDRWKKEMAVLDGLPSVSSLTSPTVRFVAARDGGAQQRLDSVFGKRGGDDGG